MDLGLGSLGGGAMSGGTCLSCGKRMHFDNAAEDDLARDCGGDCWECLLYAESAPGVAEYALKYRERALAAEALVRAKDEAIGELLGLLDGSPQPLSEVVKQPGQGPFGLPLDACHQCGRTGGSHGEMCASW